jgi:hypothetical protein
MYSDVSEEISENFSDVNLAIMLSINSFLNGFP